MLTKEQIDQLTLAEAESALKQLAKTYKLDKPIQDYMTPELWNSLDDIANNLNWLEDRIAYVKLTGHLNSVRRNGQTEVDINTEV